MKKILIATVAGIGLLSTGAIAQKKGPNGSDKKVEATPAVKSVQQLETAHALAAWGRENKNAQALLVAARMIGQVETRDAAKGAEGKLATEKGKTASTDGAKAAPVTRDSLLAEAEALGGEDPAVLAQIDAVKSEGSKGVVAHATGSGPIAFGRVVPSYTDWTYELQAAGGQPLRIAAIGDGAADIDMEVYDENNNLVCRDYDGDATPVCAMTPAWTGVFSAKIINKTGAATYVRLISN